MKALFLIFHGFDEANGISKKIRYQIKALSQCGFEVHTCYYDVSSDGHRRWMIDDKVLIDFGTGFTAKLKKRFCFKAIQQYALEQKFDFVYFRSNHNANPITIRLIKRFRKMGSKIVMEIPTYPYDQEYITTDMKIRLTLDKCFRREMAKYLNGIVTFSNAKTIFGQHTIQISNGIDFDEIPLRNKPETRIHELHLIGVAEIHYWHGFDRLVKGLANYYKNNPEYDVYFHIVGAFSGEREKQDILPIIKENQLEQYVILHGPHHGKSLDSLFDHADFAIGSLARHRSNITHIKTLKNREYAARGFGFIYSEIDEDFEHMPYIMKATSDDTPIDIKQLINFYKKQSYTPREIRESIKHLSWKAQMQKIIDQTFKANGN